MQARRYFVEATVPRESTGRSSTPPRTQPAPHREAHRDGVKGASKGTAALLGSARAVPTKSPSGFVPRVAEFGWRQTTNYAASFRAQHFGSKTVCLGAPAMREVCVDCADRPPPRVNGLTTLASPVRRRRDLGRVRRGSARRDGVCSAQRYRTDPSKFSGVVRRAGARARRSLRGSSPRSAARAFPRHAEHPTAGRTLGEPRAPRSPPGPTRHVLLVAPRRA